MEEDVLKEWVKAYYSGGIVSLDSMLKKLDLGKWGWMEEEIAEMIMEKSIQHSEATGIEPVKENPDLNVEVSSEPEKTCDPPQDRYDFLEI